MPFFCTKTGARILAPGVSTSAGGNVPDHDGSPEHEAAEQAADEALMDPARGAATPPDEKAMAKATKAAVEALKRIASGEIRLPRPGPDAPPPEGSIARLWYDRAHSVRSDLEKTEAKLSEVGDEVDALARQLSEARAEIDRLRAEPARAPQETPAPGDQEPTEKTGPEAPPALSAERPRKPKN